MTAQLSADGRMAVIIARTVLHHDGGTYDAGTTALKFGANGFEARLIELAYHWSNDLMDLALTELSIEVPEHLQESTHDMIEPRGEWLTRELTRFPDYAL